MDKFLVTLYQTKQAAQYTKGNIRNFGNPLRNRTNTGSPAFFKSFPSCMASLKAKTYKGYRRGLDSTSSFPRYGLATIGTEDIGSVGSPET